MIVMFSVSIMLDVSLTLALIGVLYPGPSSWNVKSYLHWHKCPVCMQACEMDFTQVEEVEARKSSANTNVIDSGVPSVAARDEQPSASVFVPPAVSASRPSPPPTSTALQNTVALLSQTPEIQRVTGHNTSPGSSNVPDSLVLAQRPLAQASINPPTVPGPIVEGTGPVTVEDTQVGIRNPRLLYGTSPATGPAPVPNPDVMGPSTTATGTMPWMRTNSSSISSEASGVASSVVNTGFAGPVAPQNTSPSPVVNFGEVPPLHSTVPDRSNYQVTSQGGVHTP